MITTTQLQAAATDNTTFDALVAQLDADKTITVPALRALVTAFLGYAPAVSKTRSRKALIGRLADKQRLDQRQAGRLANLDRLQAW